MAIAPTARQALLFGAVVTYMAGIYLRDMNTKASAAPATSTAGVAAASPVDAEPELVDDFDFEEDVEASFSEPAVENVAAPQFSGNGLQVFVQYCMS